MRALGEVQPSEGSKNVNSMTDPSGKASRSFWRSRGRTRQSCLPSCGRIHASALLFIRDDLDLEAQVPHTTCGILRSSAVIVLANLDLLVGNSDENLRNAVL